MNWSVLKEEVPRELIKQRQQGGATLDYIDWHTAADLLDERAPGWCEEIRQVGEINGKIFVRVAITIENVTRENIGFEDESSKGYGDPFSNAYAMAFKRAAAMFGIARHLYQKDAPRVQQQPRYPAPVQQRPSQQSAPSGDGITPKQIGAIKAMCIQQGIDVATKYPGLTDMTKRQASDAIGELQKEAEFSSNFF